MQDAVDIASTRTVIYLLTTQRMTRRVTVDNLVSMGDAGVRPIESTADLESSLPVGSELAPRRARLPWGRRCALLAAGRLRLVRGQLESALDAGPPAGAGRARSVPG